jgi:transcription initiation factor TFIIE subunit alpha
MKEKDALIRKIVKELVSEEAIPIVEYLKGKTKISEFVISEELEMEIHKTRFFLYKLLDHNLVSFIRKKDKIKGWYICYWDLNEDIVEHLDQKMKDDKIDKLQERLKREEENQFYLCRNACARMDFDRAMEFTFKCPECGEIMHQQDNTKTIDFLKERIKEIDEAGGKKKKQL